MILYYTLNYTLFYKFIFKSFGPLKTEILCQPKTAVQTTAHAVYRGNLAPVVLTPQTTQSGIRIYRSKETKLPNFYDFEQSVTALFITDEQETELAA